MKKTKLFAVIAVILGGLLTSAGILVNTFMPEKEKGNEVDHKPVEVEKCKSISLDEKNTFIIRKYAATKNDVETSYKLLKTEEDYFNLLMVYEQSDEELQLDFGAYDYLVYFKFEEKACNKTNYLTNYSLDGNKLNLEFTKYEFNKTECSDSKVYGYGIAIEKDKFIEGQTKVEVTNKEDPFKECYK